MLRDAMSGQDHIPSEGERAGLSTFEAIRDWLMQFVANRLGVATAAVAVGEHFQRLGLDSLGATGMLAELGRRLGRSLSPSLVWEFPSVAALAKHLAAAADSEVATLEGAAPAQSQSEPIAIVGMACRFPQAEDLQAYWALLRDGVDAVSEVPADRWDIDALYSPDPEAPGKIASRWGGFLRDVKVFDPAFFGISPREAIQIDPQQRLALELSWEALEDAGIPANRLRGGRCGVFVGVVWHDFADLLLCGDVPVEQHSGTGQGLSIVANRISYTLGLQGPSVALDTACSSSLVAIHLACQSLRTGESNLALVAGINLMLSPYTSELLSKFGALSPRGRCRAFDAGADGFVRGEGGGCVVLKPLSRALIDGDRIYCVIRGSAVNNDGASNGLTAPNPAAQRQVLREACGNAQVDPRAVDYVETHGTGTRLGDPIEAAALGAVLGAGRPAAAALRIGSVKTNIGHQEGASGIAGLIKTALAVHERQIPPSLHFVEPNPLIPFDDLRLQVVTSLQPWPGEKPALAGVSSFGWGGSNCHVILGGLDDLPQRLVRFAAADQDQLRQTVQAALAELTPTLADGIPSEPAAQRLSQLASRPPGEGLHRLALVTRSAADLAHSLHKWLAGESIEPGAAAIAPAAARPVAWVFSPQGGQWRGMATQLFRQDPTFRATLAACDAAIARYGHFSPLQELHQPSPQFAMTSVVQPCLFAVQVALAAMLQAHGLHPTCIIGHSVGEVSAAYVCGALSLDDAARLVVNYSRLQATTAGDGGMALVQLSLAEAQALLSADEDTLCIAGENSPDSTILSGRPAALDAVMEKLRAQGRYAARIDVNIAAHSPQMDPLLEPLRAALRGLRPRPGRLPMWSTSARGWVPGESLDGTWVAQNLRGPVHFREGIEALQGQGIELFVEVNSHPIILRSIQQTLQATGSSAFACGTLQRDQAEQQAVLSTLAQLWLRGASLDAAPTVPRTTDEPEFEPAQLLVLSAQSEAALAAQRQRLLAYLRRPARPALADLAYSLATTRSPLRHRMALVVRSFNGLEGALAAAPEPAEGGPTAIGDTSTAKLAFLFTGQGAQIAGMGQGLHRAFPAFREAFERALHLFERGRPGFLRRVMWAPAGHADAALLDQTGYTQPALFVLEYALCMQWQAWGITPDLVAGHSIGELVAACIAGVFTLEDAARLCLARAELMQALPAGGAMASIACPEATVAAAVSAHASEVAIAGVNGPEQVVISGAQAAVQRIVEAFVARGVRTKMLRVSHAFHSPLMDPMLAAFAEVARSIRYHAPTRPLISNLSGRLAGAEICTPEYWVRHVREAVRFAEGLHSLDAAGVRSFVEIGPKSTLLGLVPTCLPQREVALLPSLRAERPEDESVLAALGDLFARGRQVDWDGVFSTRRRCFDLPSYPFQRQSYWPLQPGPATLRSSSGSNASLYRFEWLERPRSSALKAGPAGKAWLILTAASGLSRELAAALTKAGRRVVVLPTDVDLATLRANLAAPEISWEGVAYLAALDTSDGEAATAADVLAQLQRMLSPVLRVNQLLTAHGLSPRQWLLTRGAWAVSPGDRPAPLQAALWGLGRVLATENPASWGGLIDLDPQAEEDDVPALLNEFLSPTAEDQLALRHHRRWAVELRPLPKEAEPASVSVIAEATYVITGGLGGLGLAVAQWLVEKGARHLVLTSRHGLPSEGAAIPDLQDGQKEAAAVVAQLVARGVQVTAAAVDVADAEAMRGLLSSLQPRVRGVLHLAGVMSDALVAQQDVALLDPVLRSKAVGAWVLHQITRDLPLDFFVLFSSVAAVLGPPGKGSYAAANAVLDALAELRRAEGLPAVSLGFGPWTGGMAKRLRKEVFAELGTRQLTDEDALSLLGRQLRGTEAQLMVAAMDWGRFAASLPPGGRQRQLTRAFLPVEPAAANPGASTAPISRADRLQSLSATVRRCVANVLGISDAAAVGGSQIFGELGLDSLMAVKLQGALQRELGQPLSSTLAFDHPTVDRLTAHLRETLFPEEAEALAAGSPLAPSQDPIAVIGMAMRWPGDVSDPQAAWALMRAGTDVVRDVPPSRWKAADWVDPTPDSGALTTVTRGGFLSDIETFDAAFFRIAPLEVLTMDPQQRMLLEVSWEALERAGQDPLALRDSRTGVFVGAGANEYAERLQDMSDVAAARYSGTGNLSSVLAGRLSYFLGLQGPSLYVDTACSSSLVALHLACQSLHAQDCRTALVGGVNLLLSPRSFVMMSQLRALSADGRCRTFAADADGYGRAEGCVVLVLKRLSEAQRDGNPILGIVRGTAINHDGASNGLTAPNGPAQQAVLRQALSQAGLSAADVDYVECHGTGTKLGDPIEVGALAAVYGPGHSAEQPLLLGALKAAVGHMEAASGLAGAAKVLLALQHGELPAQPTIAELNPLIPWQALPVRVVQQTSAWPRGPRPRRAGLSAFGLSGTNAHVIFEEAPEQTASLPDMSRNASSPERGPEPPASPPELFVLSAHSEAALVAQVARLQAHLASGAQPAPRDLAYSLACRRAALDHRLSLVAPSLADLQTQLATLQARGAAGGLLGTMRWAGAVPKRVFVFPGQGSQWLGMGRSLLRDEPVFAEALTACDAIIAREAGFSVLAELCAQEADARLGQVDVVQPLLFAFAVGLAALWRSWGIEPDVVVGHSMGEVAAAYVAGALSLDEAAAIICRRSRLLRQISGQGEMALLDCSPEEATTLLGGYEDRLSIAVSNGPRSTVISGDPAALSAVLGALQARGVFCRRVKVDVASHSPQVEPLLAELRQTLPELHPQRCRIPMFSTVTARELDGRELVADYWVQNLRQPVRFGEVMQTLLASGSSLVLELSPHPVLLPAIEELLSQAGQRGAVLPSLRREQDERATLLGSLASLWCAGLTVSWPKLFSTPSATIELPTYAWQRQRFWVDPPASPSSRIGRAPATGHPLLGALQVLSTQPGTRLWEQSVDTRRVAWLRDHCVQGAMIFPAAAYLEMALSSGRERFSAEPFEISELSLVEALGLPTDGPVLLQAVVSEELFGRQRFQVASREPSGAPGSFRVHARGFLKRRKPVRSLPHIDLAALRDRLIPYATGDANQLYAELNAMGMEYGEAFRGLRQLWCGKKEALGRVELPAAAGSRQGYVLHPALLDSCLQVLLAALGPERGSAPWLPVQVSALQVYGEPPAEIFSHAQLLPADSAQPNRHRARFTLLDSSGRVVAEIAELAVQRHASSESSDRQERWYLSTDFQPKAVPPPRGQSGRWLLLGDGGALGRALRDALQQAGHAVVQGESLLPNSTALRVLLTASFGDKAPTAIVHMGRVGVEGISDSPIPEKALLQGCDSVLHVVQALVGMWYRDVPRLWLFTRGAQAASEGLLSLTQAPLLGLARTIAVEHPEVRCIRLDLDPARPEDEPAAILAELLADDDEDEVAFRAGQRLVARLVHRQPEAERRQRLERSAGRAYRLSIEKPGVLDQLFLRLYERRPPAAGEVEIAVDAAGLNFKDVMTAMGIYPGAQSLMLGGECVGRIVAVGEGVRDLQVGQEVVAVTPGSFATHVTVAVSRVTARPASLDPIQAAALPIAYMTAWYGLVHLAHLQPGERVLIHSATGGTGLAAVHIARYLGAEVFATAGTEGKREWLRAQGVRLVMDSRALDFSAQVLAATGGAGVDVVLNSLSGPAIEASFAALGQDGRFIELSKTDIYSDRPLGLLPFRRSLSYSAVDLAALSENRPERFGRLLREVMELISASRLPTLPIETVPITRAADAFRKMAQAQHIGKLVLTLSESDALVRSQPRTEVPIRSHGSYLITGGLGALGLKVAQWLGDRGAGHLVLMGRAGDLSFEQRIAVSGLVAKGTRVSIAKGDVANRAQLEQILADIQGSGMPLCGIVHAAGALDDGLIMQQTPLRFRTVMGPKLQGAWHLHELTRHKPLDFFVMYSSAAGLLGSAGQANYAAANTFLDALAHHRHALGLPALSVDWGAFSEVGLATEQENRGARLATRGIDSLTPDQGIAALDRLLQNEVAQMGVVPLDVQRWGEFYRAVATSRRLSRLHSELPKELRSEGGVQELRVRLLAAEPKVRGALLAEVLLAQVAQVLRLAENQIAVTVPLSSLGMDSLMGLELRNRIESVLGIRVPASLLWTHPTVAVLSDYLQRALVPDERASGRTKERGKSLPFFGPAASEPGSLSASAMAAGPTRGSALVRLHSASTPKLHLVCFPPGGGGPELFQRFTTKLPLLVNISAVHLPGRSARLTEPPYGDMRQVLSGIRDELLSVCKSEIPVAFVGHSFGSVLAFEAAHDLANKGLAHPIHLFVSACASPRRGSELERYLGQGRQDASGKFSSDTLSDGELLELLRRAGALGRGAEKLDDDELAAFFIPTLRADLRVLRTYVHEDKRVVPIPITAIIGRQDPMIDADRIMEWMGHTSDSFAARIICADHGIRYEHMWSVISSQLAPLLDVPLDP